MCSVYNWDQNIDFVFLLKKISKFRFSQIFSELGQNFAM